MTNLDRLRNMNAEEWADWIDRFCEAPCEFCIGCTSKKGRKCQENIKDWLESEATDDIFR